MPVNSSFAAELDPEEFSVSFLVLEHLMFSLLYADTKTVSAARSDTIRKLVWLISVTVEFSCVLLLSPLLVFWLQTISVSLSR